MHAEALNSETAWSVREQSPKAKAIRPQLVYLLAASHSGSTLLGMLLGAQPGACTAGELKATSLGNPDEYRCSCKARIKSCGFWSKIAAEMANRGYRNFDITQAGTSIFDVKSAYAQRLLAPLYRGGVLEGIRDAALALSPAWRRHLRDSNRRNLALVESLLAVTGAGVAIDSSKLALRLKYLLKIPGLDLKVIRVIRDGRAVSLTYTDEWNFADSSDPAMRGGGTGKMRPPPRRSIAEAAREWRRSNEACDALVSQLPRSQWARVRYEDLCADPAAVLNGLAAFLSLDPSELTLNFREREQHVIGNGMRMDATSVIRLDERWKQHLSAPDLQEFTRVGGELNTAYGYQENAR